MTENAISLPVILDGEDKSSILKNRIRKNFQHVRKWAKRSQTDAFRIYDRDIKEFPIAIDFYAGKFCVHYFSFDRENEEPPEEIRNEAHGALISLFGAEPGLIFEKTRFRRRKAQQYEKNGDCQEFFIVSEYGAKFRVNLADYLDTGLFLDHRETRQMVAKLAQGKRLLNLFSYTCSFSVHAAINGASYTKSVDLSNTYLAWGKENFLLNQLSTNHNEVVRSDCFKFLAEAPSDEKYDIIVIDPPTLSRSKKMSDLFDIQLDYIYLLKEAARLLSQDGIIFFSTNLRTFRFDEKAFPNWKVEDLTEKTIPFDFHNQKIHKCWKITC